MLEHLLRHLRLVCRLLAALNRNGGPSAPAPKRTARVYGMPHRITYRVTVTVQPIYPDFEEEWPDGVLRAKSTRQQVGRAVAEAVDETLVGYRVEVRVEN